MTDIFTAPDVVDYYNVYSPQYGEYKGKVRLKKEYDKNIEVGWKTVRDFVLGIYESEMNKGGEEY